MGSPCKRWCLHYLPGLREVCRGWWVGRWGVRDGRRPPAKGFPQGLGPRGPTGGHVVSVCCPLRQDYSAIIELVETLQALPTCDVAEQHNVCFHYTFALNR